MTQENPRDTCRMVFDNTNKSWCSGGCNMSSEIRRTKQKCIKKKDWGTFDHRWRDVCKCVGDKPLGEKLWEEIKKNQLKRDDYQRDQRRRQRKQRERKQREWRKQREREQQRRLPHLLLPSSLRLLPPTMWTPS